MLFRSPISAEMCETDEEEEQEEEEEEEEEAEIEGDYGEARSGGTRANGKSGGKDLHMRCLEELQACRYEVRSFLLRCEEGTLLKLSCSSPVNRTATRTRCSSTKPSKCVFPGPLFSCGLC